MLDLQIQNKNEVSFQLELPGIFIFFFLVMSFVSLSARYLVSSNQHRLLTQLEWKMNKQGTNIICFLDMLKMF